MTRYFFHIRDGRDIFDTIGTELEGLKQVRSHMILKATAIFEEEDEIENNNEWEMEALDSVGKIIATMSFSATKDTK